MSIKDFLPDWVVNNRLFYCLACLLGVPLFVIFVPFFAPPCMYFAVRQHIYRAGKLDEKYREEAIRLRGVVQKRWSTLSISPNDGTRKYHHHFQVTYNIHQEGYIKEFQVLSTAYLEETEADLMVLPLYPRSAILALDEREIHIADSARNCRNWLVIIFSFAFQCSCRIMLVYSMLSSVVQNAWLMYAIIACEVVVVWIAGHFVLRALSNYGLRRTLFGANIIDSSNNIIPQAQMPKVTYQEMFPSTKTSFCSIIRMMIIDIAIVLGFAVVLVYFFLLGGGYLLMKPFIVDRKMKQLFADYRESGIHLRAETIAQNMLKIQIQYETTPNDFLSPTVQRYEKILPNPFQQAAQFRQASPPEISDNPQIIVLKDIPTSAQFEDEIDKRKRFYETGLYGQSCGNIFFIVMVFVAQNVSICYVLFYFANIPIIAMTLICAAVQIVLGYASASLHFRYSSKDILHNAKNVPIEECKVKDCESNIELAKSSLDDGPTNVTDSMTTGLFLE